MKYRAPLLCILLAAAAAWLAAVPGALAQVVPERCSTIRGGWWTRTGW